MSGTDVSEEQPFRFGEFCVDFQRRALYCDSERVHLTPKPFEVLVHLVRNRGRVLSKEDLLAAVWNGRRDDNTVEQAIRQIRRALQDEKDRPRFIQTIPAKGYCFIAPEAESPKPVIARRAVRPTYRYLVFAGCAAVLIAAGFTFQPTAPPPKLTNPVRITRSRTRILSPILTDGPRLYYQRYNNGGYRVAAVAATGGQSFSPSVGISDPELCDVAPDGSSLLLRQLVHSRNDNEPVYIQPASGGPARRVGKILAYDVAWYPDGRHILYAADGAVYRTDAAGKSCKRLFSVPGHAYWFRWSPDGRRLRFTVVDRETQAKSIWEVAPVFGRRAGAGSRPHRLFPKFRYEQCCGSWTANGKYFVFQVHAGSTFQIWARRESGSFWFQTNETPVALTDGPMSYRGPLPSKDGRKLFVRTQNPRGELVRYDPASKQFITLLPSVPVRTAAFSKDGKWIAYTTLTDNTLWRCRPDGSDCLQLTEPMRRAVLPRWSPDGKTIAFMGRRAGHDWGVFTVGADGENLHSPCAADRDYGEPDWSPDGQRLVFGNEMAPLNKVALYVLDLHTCGMTKLPESTGYFTPRWSPDGRFIVANHSGDRGLDIFEWTSRKWEQLTSMPSSDPNWSRDGKYVYFLSKKNGRRAIFRVSVRRRKVNEVASLASVEEGPFFLSNWFGLTPDGSPMTVRNLTTDDIYSWACGAK